MPASRPTLWETTLADEVTPAWVIDWPLASRPRRRVLVAVDASDSVEAARDSLAGVAHVLSRAVCDTDIVSVWALGDPTATAEIDVRTMSDRDRLARLITAGLRSMRGGTWMATTLAAMTAFSARALAAREVCTRLVVSDGEVFDIESLPSEPGVGFLRIGSVESPQLAAVTARWALVPPTEEGIRRFLSAWGAIVSAIIGWEGTWSSRVAADGALIDGDPAFVGPDDTAWRAAFVGGKRPRPLIRYDVAASRWEDSDVDVAPLDPSSPAHVRRALAAIEARRDPLQGVGWSRSVLADLVAGRDVCCPSCRTALGDLRRGLCCRRCGMLAVSTRGFGRREVLELCRPYLAVRFAIDHGIPGNTASGCECEETDDAWCVREQEGRAWLVLNLYR